ncbi:hypothetical protein AA103196_0989 [Ameyamaea chiangmaiensis NBRC 103196]|uniref:Lipoprotein n=1 Tax=Ameyamaea chiangmaiensis TaxID=442969 RepID=A0A850PE89_9PROT|nr:hypothetical protein [Ameyamaea chiangmaiensis]MBS4074615.1 hypothetical protein [Ameyamaea chiangmaiensis]NVN39371.1 hypothetical protein [Ameyamaea chiangmaiensis]GBQ64854.1 hypothetical protein AA103196_0989 [Ameyamaea chiangmaiensis NBRC 103196]
MRKQLTTLGFVATLTACASSPEHIQPTYVADTAYASQSCSELGQSEVRETDMLTALSDKQHRAHKTDTWGVIALGVPLSELSGSDVSRTLALEKGKMDAIHRVEAEKSCPGAPAPKS